MSATIYPPPGSNKPMQRGVITVGANATATATISAANTAKSQLTFLGAATGGGNYGANVVLTNPTTITVDNLGAANGAKVSWELKEQY